MTLISSLNDTKEKSLIIGNSLEKSRELQKSLDSERDKYAPISKFGSKLFFTLCDMSKVNNMYQISLNTFLKLFQATLCAETVEQYNNTEDRVSNLISVLEKNTFNYVSRSLLKEHRLTLALHLVKCLKPHLFEKDEWELFTDQLISLSGSVKLPHYIPEDRGKSYTSLVVRIFKLAKLSKPCRLSQF